MRAQIRLLAENRDVRYLWFGETVSSFGDFFYDIAILWYVYQKTGSGLQTGLVMVLAFLPQVIIGPFLGVLADRWNRKRLMQSGSLVQAVVTAALTILMALHHASVWEIYVITALMATAQLVYGPARSGMFPDLVPTMQRMTANSLFSISQQTARLVGSMAGGAVMVLVGPAVAIGFDAVTFVLAIVFVQRIRYLPRRRVEGTGPKATSLFRDLQEGGRWLLGKPGLLFLIGIGTVSNVALGPTNVLPPMLIKKDLHSSAAALGVFDASIGLGILVGGIVLGSLSTRRVGLLFVLGIGMQGMGMAIVAVAPVLWVACLGNLFLGVAVITAGLPMNTMFQTLVPGEVRGRVTALSSALFTVAIPITYGGVGLLGDAVGARTSYGMGALLLIAAMLLGLAVRSLRGLTIEGNATSRVEISSKSVTGGP